MQSVELNQAYQWICDDCGRENFTRAIAFEGDEATRAEIIGELGFDIGDQGELIMAPDLVTCKHCGSVYETD